MIIKIIINKLKVKYNLVILRGVTLSSIFVTNVNNINIKVGKTNLNNICNYYDYTIVKEQRNLLHIAYWQRCQDLNDDNRLLSYINHPILENKLSRSEINNVIYSTQNNLSHSLYNSSDIQSVDGIYNVLVHL